MITKTQRVRMELTQRIALLSSHDLLPREVDLAEELKVSRSTLRQVLGDLARAGAIYTIPGTGTFISDNRVAKGSGLSGFSEDMRARGMEPGSRLLSSVPFAVSGSVAKDLDLLKGSLAYRIERLRLADEVPMCIESVCLPADPFPGLLRHDLTAGLYDILKSDYGVQVVTAQQSVTAINASLEQSELLGVGVGDPLLKVFRIGFDERGQAVERATSRYRADRYQFNLFARRHGPA